MVIRHDMDRKTEVRPPTPLSPVLCFGFLLDQIGLPPGHIGAYLAVVPLLALLWELRAVRPSRAFLSLFEVRLAGIRDDLFEMFPLNTHQSFPLQSLKFRLYCFFLFCTHFTHQSLINLLRDQS